MNEPQKNKDLISFRSFTSTTSMLYSCLLCDILDSDKTLLIDTFEDTFSSHPNSLENNSYMSKTIAFRFSKNFFRQCFRRKRSVLLCSFKSYSTCSRTNNRVSLLISERDNSIVTCGMYMKNTFFERNILFLLLWRLFTSHRIPLYNKSCYFFKIGLTLFLHKSFLAVRPFFLVD